MRRCRTFFRLASLGVVLLGGAAGFSLSPTLAGDAEHAAPGAESADALSRRQIPDYAMTIAGGGDARQVPPEIVAILGEGAWQHWSWQETAAAFSPDSRILATVGANTKLWDLSSGRLLRTIPTFTNEFYAQSSARFSPNGQLLAVADEDNVGVWEVSTGKNLVTLRPVGPDKTALTMAAVRFDADGKRLTAVGVDLNRCGENDDGTDPWSETVWDISTGNRLSIGELSAEGRQAVECADGKKRTRITADGRYELSVDPQAEKVVLRNAKNHNELFDCGGDRALLSPDGKMLAAGLRTRLEVWDVARRQRLHEGRGHKNRCTAVLFSPDGSLIASADSLGTVRIWDVRTARELRSIDAHRAQIAIAFSPDGQKLASGAYAAARDNARVWDVASGKPIATFDAGDGGKKPIGAVAFSPDGQVLATAQCASSAGVMLWNTRTWKPCGKLLVEGELRGAGSSMAFSPDGKQLASGDCWMDVWDVAGGKQLWNTEQANRWGRGDASGKCLAYSPDGKRIATGGGVLRDVLSGRIVQILQIPHGTWVSDVAFHPRDQLVAVAGLGAVRLFDSATGKLVRTLEVNREDGAIAAISFSPTGRYLATANGNGTVYILRL